jgi:hypothetical protein
MISMMLSFTMLARFDIEIGQLSASAIRRSFLFGCAERRQRKKNWRTRVSQHMRYGLRGQMGHSSRIGGVVRGLVKHGSDQFS